MSLHAEYKSSQGKNKMQIKYKNNSDFNNAELRCFFQGLQEILPENTCN